MTRTTIARVAGIPFFLIGLQAPTLSAPAKPPNATIAPNPLGLVLGLGTNPRAMDAMAIGVGIDPAKIDHMCIYPGGHQFSTFELRPSPTLPRVYVVPNGPMPPK